MVKKKIEAENIEGKIIELKIELLKQPQKGKSIKREIARLLTMRKQNETKLEGNSPKISQSTGGKK
ncbi:MAG: hypothetical protein NUV97_02495 [archaeon]|nr:hypothetical protein [archaeon]MCR4323948.1 hypothetical protein [Nanoarchaeota archaeon]